MWAIKGSWAGLPTDFHRHLRQGCRAKLYDRKTPITADLLNARVIPFFENNDVKLLRLLTDRGSESCGNPELDELRALSRGRGHRPLAHQNQMPADQRHCERLHKTVLNELPGADRP